MRLLTLFILLFFSTKGFAQEPVPLWIKDIRVLASDAMEGRKTGTPGAQKSRNYIRLRYEEMDLTAPARYPDYFQTFVHERHSGDVTGQNVLGLRKGKAERFLVVTAHYDHLGRKGRRIFNGADDNASGVAAMLTLAHRSAQRENQCHIMFVATDAEEHGLYGAKAFVKLNTIPKDQIYANLNLDMLAQPGGRYEILVSGKSTSEDFDGLLSDIRHITGMPMVSTDNRMRIGRTPRRSNLALSSDHAAFAAVGIPYIYLGVGRHSYYHTPRDTSDRIDERFFGLTVESAWQTFMKMDAMCGQSADVQQLSVNNR